MANYKVKRKSAHEETQKKIQRIFISYNNSNNNNKSINALQICE
jgi:hypothetical protein